MLLKHRINQVDIGVKFLRSLTVRLWRRAAEFKIISLVGLKLLNGRLASNTHKERHAL